MCFQPTRRGFAALLALAGCLPAAPVLGAEPSVPRAGDGATGKSLRLMSYNIRLGVVDDGPNHWNLRRGMLTALLRRYDADVIGLQEAYDFQIDQIVAAVPGYTVIGVGREDGYSAGEFSALLVRSSRLRVAESGTFWFSDAPATPNSMTWGNRVTRIATWARLVDRHGGAFYVYNLHLDHQAQGSREMATALMRQRVAQRSFVADPAIVMGDFNSDEDNPALAHLVNAEHGGPWVDSFRVLHPHAVDVATFNDFEFDVTDRRKIDYVLVPRGTDVLSAAILRDSVGRRYPSDHFPVVADIRLPRRP